VAGVAGAAPVWAALMRALHDGDAPPAGLPPRDVERVDVRFAQDLEPPRAEWFIAGTGRALVTPADGAVAPGIAAPVDGTIVALDPDIPPASQRVRLVAQGAPATVRWSAGGREIARGPLAWWFPAPGRHELQLRGADGRILDRIRLEVRGAASRNTGAGARPRDAGIIEPLPPLRPRTPG